VVCDEPLRAVELPFQCRVAVRRLEGCRDVRVCWVKAAGMGQGLDYVRAVVDHDALLCFLGDLLDLGIVGRGGLRRWAGILQLNPVVLRVEEVRSVFPGPYAVVYSVLRPEDTGGSGDAWRRSD
jgi:hypothetical protein